MILRRFNSTLIKELSQYKPRPLSAAEYIQFEKTGSIAESFKFCRHELPIRLINILEESNALPISFVPEKIQEIKDKYNATLEGLLPFINAEINDENIEKFDLEINRIIHRHRYVIEKLGIGIAEFRDNLNLNNPKEVTQAEEKIHYFLDRFLINRTAAKLLCHQHLQHSAALQNKPYRQSTRCFQTLEINDIVATVAKRVQDECDAYFKRRVEVELLCWDGEAEAECEKIEMVYIQVHLEDIVYNIIKNAMRATIQHNQNQETLPSLKVLISKGPNNVTIKVSDRGGGGSVEEQQRWGGYLYSTGVDEPAANLNNPITVPMVGYGFGIPMSKVLARYLGGDVVIRSMESYGTDAFIHLQTDPNKLFEVLPVYTSKTESFYKTKNMVNEWVTGKEQKISFTSK